MPDVRKTSPFREEIDALVTLANAVLADVTALHGVIGGGQNQLLGRDQLTALIADLVALRTPLAAAVADALTMKLRLENDLLGAAPWTATLTDLGVLRTPILAAIVDLGAIVLRMNNGVVDCPTLADGTTAGKIKTVAPAGFRVAGALYNKGNTDDLWDLSAEIDTDGTHYRAYWLYIDTGGTASFVAGTDALTSEALAIAALPAVDTTKGVFGVYVAGPSTDFNGVAGLDSYGTYINGWPAALAITAANPAALTTVAPTSTNPIVQGATAGKIKAAMDLEFSIGGQHYVKAPTNDLWDLTAVANTDGTHYTAVALYLDASGVATIAATAPALSGAAALALLEAIPTTKARIGVFVAGLNTNFAAALDAQGTYYIGQPGAQTLAAAAPAAMTATTTVSITSGTTAGKLKTRADVEFSIGGTVYRKATTDDLWDLSAQTDTTGAQYRAFRLYLDSSGVATIGAGTNAASAAAALAALPAEASTKATIGLYVAGLSTDFDGVAGLAAQGTLYEGGTATESNPAALTAVAITQVGA